MSNATQTSVATVVSVWRYPVKSMMGEELNSVNLTPRGVQGDRAFALVDAESGKVASAKNPRRWPGLFEFRAAFAGATRVDEPLPEVHITLPDGTIVSSGQNDLNEVLSATVGRDVSFESAAPDEPTLEEYWPDMDDLDHRDTVTDESMPVGTFFDCAAVHLLTTATLDKLRSAYPEGRFEVRRFRPNIVLEPASGADGFVENDWVERTLSIGDEVRLSVSGRCPRCVMPTLAQGDLPKDPGILRTAVQANEAHVGIYASVLQGGTIRRGDVVRIED